MKPRVEQGEAGPVGTLLALLLLGLLALPVLALLGSASPASVAAGVSHPLFAPAVLLSLRTSVVSLLITIVTGTPLAFWLALSGSRAARNVAVVVELPVMLPPAVVGVGLLSAFGSAGLLGPALGHLEVDVAFTEVAVVLAQITVSAPFFIRASANAFRALDSDVLLVARTLGASSSSAFLRVAVPVAWPGLVVGASLAWARALGEFGATLLFAGNLTGVTQTMPLAIVTALETDVHLAVVFALAFAAFGAVLLLALRLLVRSAPAVSGAER